MNSSDRILEIFADALERPAEERAAFLQQTCPDDPLIRHAVERLLLSHDKASRFMANPTLHPEQLLSPQDLPPDAQVGPYRIIKRIGEGGYGVVYLARQDHPLIRQVALKVIKPGMDSRQVIRRFERERQALAVMNHPNIAQVFDAGSTAVGLPYFVMEYVDGKPITDFCADHGLDVKQKVALFEQVCAAVQHAHERGIIHRDLKPGNLLVMEVDGAALAKVIDFGIAKALLPTGDTATTATSAITLEAQLLGTPQYMAPEQALGQQSPNAEAIIGPQTDVYALGATLYELLAGAPPFDPASFSGGFAQIQHTLEELEPAPPSARATTRGASVALRPDLDRIIAKAMAKEPQRRYESAEALRDDLLRYREDRPVLAMTPGIPYRLKKLARRHRTSLFVASFCSLIALVLGTVTGMAMWNRLSPSGRTSIAPTTTPTTLNIAAPRVLPANLEPGLVARYFNDSALQHEVFHRVDPNIDFRWPRSDYPSPGIKSNQYSIRWTGILIVPKTGAAGIGIRADDGARLWLDGKLLVDIASPGVRFHLARLDPGPHEVRIDYWNDATLGRAELLWLPHGEHRGGEIVPPECLGHPRR